MSCYPSDLDSDDPETVVNCIERRYRCDGVQADEEESGLYLIVRSQSRWHIHSALLRDLQAAGYAPYSISHMKTDDGYRLRVGFSPDARRKTDR